MTTNRDLSFSIKNHILETEKGKQMKNRYCLIIVLLLFGFCPGLQAKTVKLIYVSFPPYEENINGKPAGILIQIVEQIFKKADIPFDLTFLPFKRGYEMVKEGQYDGIFNFYKIDERLPYFDFSAPIIKNPLVFFVHKDSDMVYESLHDLNQKKIGVMLGYTYGKEFDDARNFTKDTAGEHEYHFRKLILGRLDAYPCDKMVGIYTARKEGLMDQLKILPNPLKVMTGHIGFTKDRHKDVIEKINFEITRMEKSGKIDETINNFINNNNY